MLFVLNFYFIILVNSFIMALFALWDKGFFVILFLFVYFIFMWFMFLFFKGYKTFFITNVSLMLVTLFSNHSYMMSLSFLSFFIYFTFLFLFCLKFFDKVLGDSVNFSIMIFILFFNLLLMSFYCFLFMLVSYFYNMWFYNLFNLEEAQTFFYIFKYEFKWLMIHAWGMPVFFCLVCQCMFLLFLLSSSGYDFSKNFEDNVASWYYSTGIKELSHFHDVIYHPFKVMGSSFKFSGNYLDMSQDESFWVYISSLFLMLLLILFWMESLFFSMPINWLFWGFWNTECTHFGPLFKFLSKYFMILSMLVVMFLNLFLAISSFFMVAFMFCFSGNLFMNYEVNSGSYYEPIYFTNMDGNHYCMVTHSQFSVYHNVWFYNGIHWVLEETEECKSLASGGFYGYMVKL